MRFRHLLLPALFFLTLCNISLAQRSGYRPVYAQDSLAGFDEEEYKKMALEEGAVGDNFKFFMDVMKRRFINEKYGLDPIVEYASFPGDLLNPGAVGKTIGGGNQIFAAPCVNEGFESGNINGWSCTTGTNSGSCIYPTTGSSVTFPTASLVTTSVTPFTDPFYGFTVPNSPFSGNRVVRLNDNVLVGGLSWERVKLTSGQFNVTTTNFLYEFAYIMVASSNHQCCQQPYMRVNLLNNLGSPISCPLFTIAPPPSSGPTCSSPGITWQLNSGVYRNPTWQRYAIDLTSYIGSNVAIEVNVSNCALGGHFAYAYFDSNCGELGFTLNGTTFYSAPSGTVNIPAICGSTASLTAPTGLGPYTWNGPSGSGITNSTLQTIVTSVAGNYSISMNPPGICAPITRVINLSFPPPTTVVATPSILCRAGSPSTSTLSATGANSYTWSTGSNSPTIAVSPTVSTVYSVAVQSGTCIGTRTLQVLVAANPTLTVSNPTPNICSGGTTTITASGASANNYTWQPGSIIGSVAAVSPVAPGQHVYTVTGRSGAGCVDTETTIVTVTTASAITLFNFPTTVCAGSPVTLVGTGYGTFTWMPTGQTGGFVVTNPTITTTYTAIGGVGSCTNTATITVGVDQGPVITTAASPTITCPGVSATLTATSPTAIGSLTWMPGSSTGTSLVVSPTVSTVYSVSGVNANTCRSTYTINKLVAPNPTISFAPASPTVCFGSALTLTASGGTGYTCTPAPVVNTATRVVTPTVNTVYSVAVSNGSCTSNSSIQVTVVPTPTVTASSSPTAICRGSSATLTANGATNYTWQPGSLTGSSTVVSPSVTTTYTVTGNSAGCTDTETVTVVVNPLPVVTVTASPPTICRGSCSTLTPGGAQTYTIQPGFSNIVCPTVTTTYSITGTSSLGCVSANPATLTIVVNNTPNITFLPSSPTLCAGGTVAVTAIGGTQYTWQPGNLTGNSQVLSPTATTVYTVTASNAFACTSQRTLNVTVLPTPTVTAAANPSILCSGATTTLSASGATSYTWNPGNLNGATVSATPSITTTYTVRGVTGGCSGTRTVLVTVNPTPTITASASPTAICSGQTATLTANGAASYTWMPGSLSGANVTVSPASNTTYTVTGSSSGCSSTATLTLVVNPNPTITASASPSTICRGSCSTITPAGAQTYTILPGFSNIVCPTITTTYSITGTSSAGCVSSQARTLSIVVNNTPNIVFLPSTPTVCPGRTVQVNAIGGISYTWNPGNLTGNSQILSPSVTTVYTVTASNAFGCTGQRTVAVTVRPSPTITVAANPTTVCPAACSTLTPSGALTYTYSSGSNVVCPTVTTTYSVNGTNNFGCVSTTPGTVTVNVSPPPTLSFSPSSPSICAGSSVNVTASGANAYTWNPGNLTGASQNLAPGTTTTYTVSGSNAAGCVGQGTVTVTVIPTPTVGASASPATICQGATAALTATGATSYTWQPGGSTSNPVNVTPTVTTIYTVTGSNSGCTGTRTVAVTVTPLPTITAVASPSTICTGNSSTITANGATTYTWSTGASGAGIVVSPTVNTVYTVTGTTSGCTATRTVAVNVNSLPAVFAISNPTAICAGNTATLSAGGGISFTWQPGALGGANVTVSPVSSTIYTVSASDGTCVGTATVNLVVNPTPTVGATASPTVICRGNTSTLTGTGASGYTWNPGGLTGNPVSVTPTITTIYTVTGASGAGCTGTRTVQVTVNPLPTITAVANPTAVCPGFCSTLSASGAQTYTYSSGSNVVCPTVTTTYSVSGTSSLGCVSTTPGTVTVVVNPTPTITLTILNATICAGGTVNINAVGAISYTWMPGNLTGSTQALTPSVTTVYTVTGANAQGCTGQRTTTITVIPNPTVNASASPATICNGSSTTLTASGATSYFWNPGGISGNPITVTPTATTIYTVTGTGAGGCFGTRTVAVNVNPQPTISVTSNAPAGICPGQCATLTASGAQTYTYSSGGNVVCPTVTTTYSVSGTSSLGCVSAQPGTVSVFVHSVPSVTLTASAGSICAGSSVTITASGAANYTWMPGSLGGTVVAFTPTATTTYTVMGRLSPAGCTGQNTITVVVVPNPTITASPASTLICPGSTITLSASGATTYTWMPGGMNGATVSVAPASSTNYTVIGSTSGCSSMPAVVSVSVSSTVAPIAAVTPTSVCTTGCASLTLSGAAGTIQWQMNTTGPVGPWSNIPGANTSTYTFCGITANTWFQGAVTNSCGTSISNVVSVSLSPSPVVSVTPNPAQICAGSTVALSASGGSTYTWTPATGLSCTNCANPVAGPASTTNYTVTAASVQGCTSTAAVVVSVVPNPTVNATASPATICSGAGSTLSATGATSYTWMPGGNTGSTLAVTPPSTTIYTVTGITAGCSGTRTLQVTVNPLPTVTAVSNPTSVCPGFCATLSASGAQTYTYLNGGPVVCPTVTTTYSVSGTSSLGCTSANPGMVTVVVNTVPVVVLTPSSASICAGSSVSVTASGGTSYTWNPGGLTGAGQLLSPVTTTVYTVTAVNAQGCSAQQTIGITVSPVPVVNASASPGTICDGSTSTLTASGAVSYTWMPGGINGNPVVVSPSVTTIYTVTGSSSGCTGTSTVIVNVNPQPTITAVASPTAGCPGFCSTITATGAQTYTYSSGSNVVCPTVTATYSVTGTDANGCVSAIPGTVTIVLNPNPSLSASASPTVLCDGQTTTLTATGATGYTWMPGSFTTATVAVTPTANTIYTVTGDNGNCGITATVFVMVNPNPTLNVTSTPASICTGNSSTLAASGASGYTWTPGSISGGTISVSPTVTTVYTVNADNAFGCTATETVAVTVGSLPTLTITSTSNTVCSGSGATLTASGTLSYTWNPGGMNGATVAVSPVATTVYTITGSNGPGCTNTETFALVVSPIPSITASVSTNPVCEGFPTSLTASGASSYTWNPGALTGSQVSVSPTVTTTYTVDGDALGCVASTVVTVNVLPLPTITAVASPTAVCTGNSTTLTATGAVSYTWLPMAVTGASVADTPTSTITYTVAGIGANGCPNADTITVFVLPPPNITATASGTAVCLGSSATLIATGGVTYTWEPGSITGDTIVVAPNTPTTYTVTGDNGACTGTAVVSIGINPLPTITVVGSASVVCEGLPVTFTASGANNYTWNPNGQTGPVVTENPTVSITYTVTGEDANGCTNTANISVSVNPSPTMIAIANPTSICEGDSSLLSGSGALSYTWNPMGSNSQTIMVTPAATSVYTLSGTDAIGCIGSGTVQVSVFPTPTISVSPGTITICSGSPATLTATGATNYTWMPGGANGSVTVETPTVNTTYTVTGDNGGTCFHTATVDVFVNPLPANVTASVTGTITCSSPSVDLLGSSTDTNVSYAWSGPLGFTSAVQNPTGVTVWGIFTLSVTDNSTGCVATATVDVATDNSVPLVTATASGSITCSVSEVTLNAVHTTTNPGYSWTGPGSFTAAAQSVTVGAAGQYTVVVTDLSSSCSASAVVTVGTHTAVTITATMIPATCTAGVSNNDGTIMTSGFGPLDKFDLVAGTSYTGSATYSTAITIPGNSIVTSNLANPTTTTPYTLRLFDSEGCIKDTTLYLIPVDCSLRSLGIAKAVSTPSLNSDNSYDVVYTISVKNYDTAALSAVVLTENLASTFPAPATFSVVSVNSSGAGSLVVNTGFNGGSDPALTTTASAIAANSTYSLELRVRVVTNGVFGPYNNSVSGAAVNNISVTVTDVSTEGLDPDPDTDGNPKNNSLPTVLNFSPNLFFGLTKEGSYMLTDNNTYDVTYTITIHNRGNDTLRNVTVNDSLFNNTIRYPATYTMKSAPVTTGSLVANAGFNGNSDIRLLDAAASVMGPGEVSRIVFAINVVPDTVTVVSNSAAGRAVNVSGGTQVTDISNAGSNPDSNSNGIWNEAEDNVPTVLVLPLLSVNTPTLFIPGGFSPDGDGVNDVFVIKGLPKDAESSIVIFNRWGNRVYQHANYAEAEPWDGTPNIAGTLGRNKLPQGTYYYVLDIKGSGMKPITGFIVLQY